MSRGSRPEAESGHDGAIERVEEVVSHPYAAEIGRLLSRPLPLPLELELSAPRPPPPAALEATPWHWVATPEALRAALCDLLRCRRVSLDLEHHAQHCYHGTTCLLQLSTGRPRLSTVAALIMCACIFGCGCGVVVGLRAFLRVPGNL